jgi:CheY-like chemotaxis protein
MLLADDTTVTMTRPNRCGRGPVLLVEDDELNQALAVAFLTRLGDSTQVAATGRAAVETVAPGTYRAVLLDCQPPGLDGYQATAETRRREATARHTPSSP